MCHNNLCLYCYLLDIGDASSGSTSETRRDQSDEPGKRVTSLFLLIIIVVSQSVNASTSTLSSTTGGHCTGILDQGIS